MMFERPERWAYFILSNVSANANHRMTGNYEKIADNPPWGVSMVADTANAQEERAPFTRWGSRNRPHMLQIGQIDAPNQFNTVSHPIHLTPGEQCFQVSSWSLRSAPQLLACDVNSLADFTLGQFAGEFKTFINAHDLFLLGLSS